MKRGSGNGPASGVHAGIRVGADWAITCHSYPDRTPILSLNVGTFSFMVSAADQAVTADHMEFAWALVEAANDYLNELERLDGEARERAAHPTPVVQISGAA